MKYSKITYIYSGGDTVFSIPFEYTKKEFISVYINNEELESDYIIDTQTIIINRKIEIGASVTIQRKTDLVQLVDFTTRNNLKSFDLNLAFLQILHVMQEQQDYYSEIMPLTPDGNWNAQNRRITNLAPAISDSDAVRKDQIISLTYEGMDEIEKNLDEILTSKGKSNGFATLDENGLLEREQLPIIYERFCINSGAVDANGEPDILQYTGYKHIEPTLGTFYSNLSLEAGIEIYSDEYCKVAIGIINTIDTDSNTMTLIDNEAVYTFPTSEYVGKFTAKAPFVYTTIEGKTYSVNNDLTVLVNEDVTENIRIFVDRDTEGVFFIEALLNEIYVQKKEPDNPKENDFWIDTSVSPELQFRRNSDEWIKSNAVEIGYRLFIMSD